MSLFPTTQRSNHLVEFNAGKVIREGNMLKPDTRKGVIYMDQSDDQLIHFYWKERKAADPEDDFIIFPDEAELIRVNECTTGRVYVLKFKSSSQKVFYWMQNKNDEKDEELVERVNQLINDPQSVTMGRDSDLDYDGDANTDLMQILSGGQGDLDMNMTQDNLLQFLQNAGNLGHRSLSIHINRNNNDDDINASEGYILPRAKWAEVGTRLSEINPPEEYASLDVGDALKAEALNSILHYSEIRSALFPFISESSERSEEEIQQLVESQQFQQRLQVLNTALRQGVLSDITSAIETTNDLRSFLEAVVDQAKRKRQRESNAMEED
ncbi:proteasome complex subunit Rpn13 ubiquitin receptor-domain-containing protein [Cokeromyces recurvatus]|uniref:proteasome complex subunit Rpn13 ubiquitin receptor-domain-containing protein n=1 Tax=Cokeromyces recurvatus TaxID=90255 RepID=UPI00221F9804|nr:proteasome complex subunit Rpn13 ubiquitin receptor-domain-containing protein [Cokeromyces recurvatus]KAI7905488.1 proteasome complex subunit Rpn13 ubiquitin receptor-domain-containing protein [Cokeromyces recurvatus]